MRNKIVVFFVIVALIAMIIIPLAGCTNGDETTTKTNTNPIVALQEDVDELNDNFNTEVANIKSRLSTLETSSIPANITNRVATLEANVAALQVTVNALSAGDSVDLTALTEAVNDIADDVLAAHSSIDVIRGDVNDINLDITDLKNKYNSITIPDYDSRIQEVELRIVSILSSVQTYGDDITDIKDDIVDIIDYIVYMTDYIVLNTHNISALDNELNNVISRLSAVENRLSALAADCDDRLSEVELRIVGILDDLQGYETEIAELQSVVSDIQDDIDILFANDAALQEQIDVLQGQVNNIEIISFNEVADYLTFRTNVAGSYAVVITYYGTEFDETSTVSIPTADNVRVISSTVYGASGTMLKVILEPAQVLAGNPPVLVDTNWVAGKLVGVTRIGAGDVEYATIEIAVR